MQSAVIGFSLAAVGLLPLASRAAAPVSTVSPARSLGSLGLSTPLTGDLAAEGSSQSLSAEADSAAPSAVMAGFTPQVEALQASGSADASASAPAPSSDPQLASGPAPADGQYFRNPFNLPIPLHRSPWDFSHKKHCDVLRHLKVPATYRRIDTYMRPEYMLPLPKDNSLAHRDQLLSFKEREELYEKGVDIYGCSSLDYLTDVVSNLSSIPIVRGTQGPWHDWQLNINQVLGVDLYSRLVSKTWNTGQIHLSFTWPEAGNLGPIYSYGNTLNPAGLGTRQYQGYFYTDVGRSRDVNSQMQGARLFEYWFDQRYGYKKTVFGAHRRDLPLDHLQQIHSGWPVRVLGFR